MKAKTVKVTMVLDFNSSAKLFTSWIWSQLMNLVEGKHCIEFKVEEVDQ